MSDTSWMSGLLTGSGLLAPTPTSYSAREMRQKIALAMLMKKQTAPKTFGEGLYSIGDSISDAYTSRQLERQAAAEAKAIETGAAAMPGLPVPSAAPSAAAPAPAPAGTTGPRSDATDDGAATPATSVSGVHPNVASWNNFATRPYEEGGLGVAPHQAAGIVGNLQAESGPTIKPVGLVGDAGTAFGAAQWRNDRFANLQNFAKANGMDPMTTEAQQQFMRHELRGSGPYGGGSEAKAFNALSSAQDPRSAAAAFDQSYERSDGSTRGRRMSAADNLSRILSDPSASSRDRIAAVAAARTADTPLTPADTAQEARVSDVMGMTRAPPSFAPTASLQGGRTGNIQSDMPPVTGALQGPMGAAVGDTVQQRQDAIQPPQPDASQPPGPQLAQAGPFPPPPGPDAGGRIPAIMPGGGLPPAPPTAAPVPAAPPDPRTAIRSAPVPEPYQMEKPVAPIPPTKPTMGPIEQQLTRDYLNKDIPPQLKAIAQQRIDYERGQLNAVYENQKLQHEMDKAIHVKKMETYDNWLINKRKDEADTQGKMATTDKTLAEIPETTAKGDVAQMNAAFQKRVGREREPALKDLALEKEQVNKAIPMIRDTQLAQEALDSGAVVSGFGADAKLNAARIAAKIGSQDAQKIANESEKYQKAMDRTISYGIMLVNGKDPRVTEGDVAQAKGMQGTPDMQEASKRKIIAIMREDLIGKVSNYEDIHDTYLRGDPQHRMFKVDAPSFGASTPEGTGTRDILLKNPTDTRIIEAFDAMHGKGAAKLEIQRAMRGRN